MTRNDRRLIEDYLPVDWLSAEASGEPRTKGHISTLHLWRARRPLVACRAAVYSVPTRGCGSRLRRFAATPPPRSDGRSRPGVPSSVGPSTCSSCDVSGSWFRSRAPTFARVARGTAPFPVRDSLDPDAEHRILGWWCPPLDAGRGRGRAARRKCRGRRGRTNGPCPHGRAAPDRG